MSMRPVLYPKLASTPTQHDHHRTNIFLRLNLEKVVEYFDTPLRTEMREPQTLDAVVEGYLVDVVLVARLVVVW